MSRRTERVIVKAEGQVLKKLRAKSKMSMKQVAEEIGLSDTYISQIENSRSNPPKGETLIKLLDVYKVKPKYFSDLCRAWELEITPEQFIVDNVSKLSPDNQKLLQAMMETMLARK